MSGISLNKEETHRLLAYTMDTIDALKNTLEMLMGDGNESRINESIVPVYNLLLRVSDQAYLEIKRINDERPSKPSNPL